MVALSALAASCALAMPFMQDDLTRRQQQQQRQQQQREQQNQRQPQGLKPESNVKPQDDKTNNKPKIEVKSQAVSADDEEIPDSLLHPRWQIQRTTPITYDDLDQNPADLKRPDNLKQDVVYNDTIDRYIIGSKISDTYLNAPIMMTPEEYRK